MKKNVKDFCVRGLMFAWGGPAIMVIIWLILNANGQISELSVGEVALGVFTTTVLAFIAAGITIVHQIENLPKPFAALIHFAVIYIDYLGVYLLNGWIALDKIWIFTIFFIVGFILIWLSIYLPIRIKVSKMNQMINN